MCDEKTEADNETDLQNQGLRRRELGLGASAAAAALSSGCSQGSTVPAASPEPAAPVPTPTGQQATAAAVQGRDRHHRDTRRQRRGVLRQARRRQHPAVLVWPGVAGLDQQEAVDTARKIATTGSCMGGPFTFRTAAATPDRVGALGSFHGGGLVTADPASPHQLVAKMKAAALVCIAQNDDTRQPDVKTTQKQATDAAGDIPGAPVSVRHAPRRRRQSTLR